MASAKMEAPLSLDLLTLLAANAETAKIGMGFMLPLQFVSL